MIGRRSLAGLTAAALARATTGRAAGLRTMRLGSAAGIIDPQLSFMTVGMYPKLGYYAQDGVKLDIVNMSSTSQSLQAVATDAVELATVTPVTYLPVVANNPRLDVVAAYQWCRQPYWEVAVKPDSPAKTLADLKGKKIGIRNPGDTGYIGAKDMFRELGMDPETAVEWVSVGTGGPAGDALYRGRVDALAIWDAALARVELNGFKLRTLPDTPATAKLGGSFWGVSRQELAKDRTPYVGLFRGIAKSTLFVLNNIDAAIKIHWELFPESKPKGVSPEQALQEARFILARRAPKWLPKASNPDKRFGASSLQEWKLALQYTNTAAQISDPSKLFTNELIDDINRFDPAEIKAQAKAMQI